MADNIALVVDDTPANRDFLARLITQTQMQVLSAADGTSALAEAEALVAE